MDRKPLSQPNFLKISLAIVIAAISILGGLVGLESYIENKVEKIVLSKELIEKVQSHVQPSMIFDQNSTILSDMGAWQYIDDLQVIKNQNDIVSDVLISFKKPNIVPILTSLDNTITYAINRSRGEKLDVVFNFDLRDYSEPRSKISLFRLELVSGEGGQNYQEISNNEKIMHIQGRIVTDGIISTSVDGERYANISNSIDITFTPHEGDMYFDTKEECIKIFSNNKWRRISLDKQ